MRVITAAFCVMLTPSAVAAQALDIGGIELRLGQNISDALKALSPYQTSYSENGHIWVVTRRGEAPFVIVGTLAATDGKVTAITKVYPLSSEYDASPVYTEASKEVRRRGGAACET